MIAAGLCRSGRSILQTSQRLPAARCKASLGASQVQEDHGRRLKTLNDLPGPSPLETLYWVFLRGYLFYTHELERKQKKKYGPMWVTNVRDGQMVIIAGPHILESLLKQEGQYPMRAEMDLWKEHRDLRGHSYGPLTEEGHQWQTLRSALNQKMLKPTEAAHYADSLNEIIPDLFNKIQELKAESPSGLMVENVAALMYKFAFESICTVIFETRIGSLKKEIPEETQKLINSIGIMLESQNVLEKIPRWTKDWLPYWGRFMGSWDTIFNYGSKLIHEKIKDIEGRLQRGDDLGGAYLTFLLTNGNLNVKEVCGVMPELLQAGVDTTSNTLTWALYQLAINPDIQQSLYEEVIQVIPDHIPSTNDINKMPLLKAVIKETLRLYPVVPENGRIRVDKEVVLDGYIFPKKTQFILCHYVLSRDENSFPDPDRFLPRRWLRSEGTKHHHPFSSIPFGFGVRGCLGRRVAELEMHLALSQLIKKFQVLPDPDLGEVHTKNRIVLIANKQINLQFIDRQ